MARGIRANEVPVVWLVIPTVALFLAFAAMSLVGAWVDSYQSLTLWRIVMTGGLAFTVAVAITELTALVIAIVAFLRTPQNRSVANAASVLFGAAGLVVSVGVALSLYIWVGGAII